MRCPFCGHDDSQVKDSRPSEDNSAIRRRRHCPECGGRFTTFERVQLRELIVVKKNGRRESFRPRQAGTLDQPRPAQAPGGARAGGPHHHRHRAPPGIHGRERDSRQCDRRAGDAGAGQPGQGGLCPLRLGLQEFPRDARFRDADRRARRRRRKQFLHEPLRPSHRKRCYGHLPFSGAARQRG